MSVLTANVRHVQPDDLVDPRDAALYQILGGIAENTKDEQRQDKVIDFMLTIPPLAEWPLEVLEQWRDLYHYIRSLRRECEQRQLERMFDQGGEEYG